MKAFGVILGAAGTIFIIFINLYFGLGMIILAAILLLIPSPPPRENLKKCPRCAEMVKKEAQVCRFCNFEFGPASEIRLIDKKEIKSPWFSGKSIQN